MTNPLHNNVRRGQPYNFQYHLFYHVLVDQTQDMQVPYTNQSNPPDKVRQSKIEGKPTYLDLRQERYQEFCIEKDLQEILLFGLDQNNPDVHESKAY